MKKGVLLAPSIFLIKCFPASLPFFAFVGLNLRVCVVVLCEWFLSGSFSALSCVWVSLAYLFHHVSFCVFNCFLSHSGPRMIVSFLSCHVLSLVMAYGSLLLHALDAKHLTEKEGFDV